MEAIQRFIMLAALFAALVPASAAHANGGSSRRTAEPPLPSPTPELTREELQDSVPSSLVDEASIFSALRSKLGASSNRITWFQSVVCGIESPTGHMVAGGETEQCLRRLASAITRARRQADADRGRCASGSCRTSAPSATSPCGSDAATDSGSGPCGAATPRRNLLEEVKGLAEAIAKKCPEGQQVGVYPDGTPGCLDARWQFSSQCRVEDVGGAIVRVCQDELTPFESRLDVPHKPHEPYPETPSACDGFWGAMLCYVTPTVVILTAGALGTCAALDCFESKSTSTVTFR